MRKTNGAAPAVPTPDAQEAQKKAEAQSKARKSRVKQSDVPRHSLQEALRIPRAIEENYAKKPTKPLNIAIALNMSPASSHFRMLIGASSAYGLTDGAYDSEVVSITDLGRRIIAPTAEGVEEAAMREAFLTPRVMNEFLNRYNSSKLPTGKIAQNVLEETGVPADSTEKTFQLILKGASELGLVREHKGQWYVDLDSEAVSKPSNDEDNADDVDDSSAEFVPGSRSTALQEDSKEREAMPVAMSPANNRVFITHGKNLEVVTQLKELLGFGGFVPIVAAEHETVSKPVPDKVMDDMRSCYAAIIHVGKEMKLIDQSGNEHIFVNQNVLIEIGAAMALYGRRFILLVERGATLPSNLQGLYEVRYEGDKLDYDATMKLLKAFNDFKV